MSFPTFTVADLSGFSGRPEAAYTAYANQALYQSMVLFRVATCLTDWPTNELDAELAQLAVLSLADQLVLGQPFQSVTAGPYSGEVIGSYSYSLRNAATIIYGRLPIGPSVSFWDLAVGQLGVCDSGGIAGGVSGGSVGVFEDDAIFWVDEDGKKHVVAPHNIDAIDFPFDDGSTISVFTDPGL